MSYIGNTPTQQNFVAGADQFSGNGSTTAFTLSRNVNTVFDIFVAISNVPQDPYSAYSVSGNTLTFTSAPPSGTGNIYVVYRATNVQTFVPTQGVSPSFGNLTYTGTLTGSTGVINIGSGQVYKDASGNVGIGTSSPNGTLNVKAQAGQGVPLRLEATDAGANPQTVFAGSRTYQIGTGNASSGFAGQLFFYDGTAAATRMVLDSSGNVGIGSTSITRAYANYNQLNLNGTSGATIQMQAGGTSYANFVADSNALYVQGQTAIAFGVGGSGTGTERARIDSNGTLFVGGTANPGPLISRVITVANGLNGVEHFLCNEQRATTGTENYFRFYRNNSLVGSITNTLSNTAYNTSSDYRLKENVQPMTGALAKIAALKPCTYTWKVDGSDGEGFIAHELAEVCPGAVTGEKDAVNEDGSIKPQGIDTSFLVATLTAAIQELNAKVEAQAAEIAALKGAA